MACAWAGSIIALPPVITQLCSDTAATIKVSESSLRRSRLAAHLCCSKHVCDCPAHSHEKPEMDCQASEHPVDHFSGQLLNDAPSKAQDGAKQSKATPSHRRLSGAAVEPSIPGRAAAVTSHK